MTLHAPLNHPVVVTLSNGTKAIGTFSHPYGVDIAFDFGDASASFYAFVLSEEDKKENTVPPHVVSWQPAPRARQSLQTCPVNTLGVVERRDGTLHVGMILETRDRALARFEHGGNRASFHFPVNGDSYADDAPVAWMALS